MADVYSLLAAVGGSDGINIWGMLGCAVAYAGAVFAGVDGLGDHLLRRSEGMDAKALSAMRLKTGSKVAASLITVATAAVVLVLDGNWIALALLTGAFMAILLWVFYVYREAGAHRSGGVPR
jgi:hypothetical protein